MNAPQSQASTLQQYNSELLKCIETMCTKRDEIHKQIVKEEMEKKKIQDDLRTLTERLTRLIESLAKKYAAQNEFDKTIAETEAAYMKIIESSQTLVQALKKEVNNEHEEHTL